MGKRRGKGIDRGSEEGLRDRFFNRETGLDAGMAVKIRLQRGGATHAPHYRVVVADERSRRDGRFVERVGTYDPCNKVAEKQLKLNLERVDYWLGVGAQPTDTVRSLIRKWRREQPSEGEPVAAGVAESDAEASAGGEESAGTGAAS